MVFMVFSAVMLVIGVVAAVGSGRKELAFQRAKRQGVELQAEVMDNAPSPSGNKGAYYLTPVVRYRLEGHTYTAELANASATPGIARGSGVTIVVHPDHPYEPFDRFGGMGAMARGSLLFLPLSLVLVAMAAARL